MRLRFQIAHAVLTCEDALNEVHDCLMILGRGRGRSRFGVRREDIRQQVTRVLFADDFEIRQGEKQRLADAKSGNTLGTLETYGVCHVISFR